MWDELTGGVGSEARKKVRMWLTPPGREWNHATIDHEEMTKRRHVGTGEWVLPVLQHWKEEETETLWFTGGPGCGKSLLASNIIDTLAKEKDEMVLWFYFRGDDTSQNSALAAVKSFLLQLLNNNPQPEIAQHLQAIRDKYDQPTAGPDLFPDLLSAFTHCLSLLSSKIFCILDGIDEMAPKSQSFEFLQTLTNLDNARCILLSRPEPRFSRLPGVRHEITPSTLSADITAFVTAKVNASETLALVSQELRDTIVDTLSSRANGVFLWVALVLSSLESATTSDAILSALSSLPTDLRGVYQKILDKLPQQEEAKRVLGLVTVATHPLEVEAFEQEGLLVTVEEWVKRVCGPLLRIREGRVEVCHFTLREWLREEGGIDEKVANGQLATRCLSFLSSDDFRKTPEAPNVRLEQLKSAHPFLEYALFNWCHHFLLASSPCAYVVKSTNLKWMEDAIFHISKTSVETEQLFSRALTVRTSALTPGHPETLRTRLRLAEVFQWQGRVKQAEEAYRSLCEASKGNPSYLPTALSGLARALERQKRWPEAEETYRQLFALSPSPATTNRLAWTLLGQHRTEEAEELYTANLPDKEAAKCLATIYETSGKHDEAENVLRRVEACEAELAAFYARHRRPEEAAVVLERVHIATSTDVTLAAEYASILTTLGRKEEAEEVLSRTLGECEHALGECDETTILAAVELGKLCLAHSKPDDATTWFETAHIRCSFLPLSHPLTLAVHQYLPDHTATFFASCKTSLGPGHRSTLQSGRLLASSQQPTEAVETLQWVLEQSKRYLGEEGKETLRTAEELAGALEAAGRREEARGVRKEVKEGRRRTRGVGVMAG
jgi:tetratricopeptide (TPR) repeat protein